jgi:hypothetical protein
VKVLANRLKQVLPEIISQQQGAFLPGRLISNNILVAYDALHTMATPLSGKKGYMAIKLDMSKAYDRVKWQFLEGIMRKLGFDEAWISLIMTCVCSVSYSVLINGRPAGLITPSRGLRQGDSLSPYLFLLCVEGLSSLLQKAEREGSISGVPVSVKGYKLSHLFFADDSLLFYMANSIKWGRIHQLLRLYESASSQKLYTEKTSIFFPARIQSVSSRSTLILLCEIQQPRAMRNIWDYQPWWVVQRRKLLLESREELGRNWRVGRRNSFHRQARKFFSRQWFKPSPHMP